MGNVKFSCTNRPALYLRLNPDLHCLVSVPRYPIKSVSELVTVQYYAQTEIPGLFACFAFSSFPFF